MRNNEEHASGKRRIIGYMRVSTKKQKLTLQKELLKKAGCEVIYSDLGVSGKTYPRKGLTKALKSLKSGDQLVVYKLDRLTRHVLRAALLLQYFKDKDIHFSSLTEAFDIQTPDGRFMYYFCSIMAEAESDRTGMRTKDGMRSRKAKGVVLPEKRLFVVLKDMDTNKNLLMWDKSSDLRLDKPITEQYIYLMPLSPNSELIAPLLNKTILPFTSIKAPKIVSSDRPIVFKGVNSANLLDIMKCDNITRNKKAKIKSISGFSIGTKTTKTHKRGVMSKEQEKTLGEKLYYIIGKHNIEDRAATIAELLLQGAPLNYQDPDTENSYLHHAAATNDRKAINELIQHDDLNYLLRNKRKWLPSYMAQRAMNGYDMVEFFTEEEQAQGRREGLSVQLFNTMPIKEGPPPIKPLSNDMA